MKLTIYQDGSPTVLEYSTPTYLSTLFASGHIPFAMPCGGRGSCHKCKVRVQGQISPITKEEASYLTDEEIAQGIRYACMTTVYGDAEVTLPDTSAARIVSAGQLPVFALAPWADGYGAAFDIGTTTVAAYLYRLVDGKQLASASQKNPQVTFGGDVISRITHALHGGSATLAEAVRGCINELLHSLCQAGGISMQELHALVLSGNTAMEYLLMGANPASIAQAPFRQDRYFGEFISASSLGLEPRAAKVYVARCISAYVGGDITSGILSTGMLSAEKPELLIDIGTNGEIALAVSGKILCCSTAAGPAFEGAGIFMGMTASDGAIAHVHAANGTLTFEAIGESLPVGICGSGIIDAVAAFLTLGYIDETGAIDSSSLPEELLAEADGVSAIRIPGSDVCITQKDIRAVQLAKSAICSGVETLLEIAKLRAQDIGQLLIAGGFGSVLYVSSAEAIGLIPSGFSGRIKSVGNAAGMGAIMQLLSRDMIHRAEQLARTAETVELSTHPVFREAYIENMLFPL